MYPIHRNATTKKKKTWENCGAREQGKRKIFRGWKTRSAQRCHVDPSTSSSSSSSGGGDDLVTKCSDVRRARTRQPVHRLRAGRSNSRRADTKDAGSAPPRSSFVTLIKRVRASPTNLSILNILKQKF